MKDITHSICRFTLIGGALAAALVLSDGAQAWDSRTQFYSEGGAYLGEARTRINPGIDASIPLQIRGPNPNAFGNGFARGLELRELQDELNEEESAYEAHLDDKLYRLLEAEEELRQVQLRRQAEKDTNCLVNSVFAGPVTDDMIDKWLEESGYQGAQLDDKRRSLKAEEELRQVGLRQQAEKDGCSGLSVSRRTP